MKGVRSAAKFVSGDIDRQGRTHALGMEKQGRIHIYVLHLYPAFCSGDQSSIHGGLSSNFSP